MTLRAKVDAGLFELVSRCAANNKEPRQYLRGVFLTRREGLEGVVMVATDGRRMLVAHDPNGMLEGEPFIVGTADDKALVKAAKVAKKGIEKTLEIAQGGTIWTVTDKSGASVTGGLTEIDWTYPDWVQVVPSHFRWPEDSPPSPIFGDAKYIEGFAKVADDLSKALGTPVRICMGAENTKAAAIVSFTESKGKHFPIFGVLMSTHVAEEAATLPDFMTTQKALEEAA